MNRWLAPVVAGILIGAFLAPVASVAVPTTPVDSAQSSASAATRASGADCVWGTTPAAPIPVVDYPRGYLSGFDWSRDYPSPYECALGPSWLPYNHGHPLSSVFVSSEEFNSFSANQRWCTSLADASCSADDWELAVANLALGYCATDAAYNCIESLEVVAPDGSRQQARYLRGFPELAPVPEFREGDAFAPAGGSVPLWEFDTPGGPVQIMSVGKTEKMFVPQGTRWTTRPGALFKLILRPTVIEARSSLPKPTQGERVDASTGATRVEWQGSNHPDAIGCFAIDAGECARDATFPKDYRYRVSLRLRDETSMYLNGAVDNPVAYSEKLSGGHRFIIEAGPSPVLGMAGWIPKAQVPQSLVDATFNAIGGHRNWDMATHAVSGQPQGRGGIEPLAWLNALMPYFGDRASFIVDSWYVENTPTQGRYTAQCMNQGKGEFIGIVASNATAYTGDPPTYDGATSSLSYEIAGPHYMPDGTTLSRGRYSINMNANFVKCILGVDKVPSVARVELIYPDGEASAATLALKQDRNWLRLIYENFTFSSPTVNVRFPGKITCIKGKGKKTQSKEFIAFNCPKGWKPKG